MKNLSGKNAIITGAAKGIGWHIARCLARAQVNLALVDLPGEVENLNRKLAEVQKFGIPFQAAYAARKAGLIQWSAALRDELEGSGVGLSVVIPGYVNSAGMFADYRKKALKEYKTPVMVGEVLPNAVAEAVIKCIRNPRQQVIVSPGAWRLRVILAMNELFPGFAARLMDVVGVTKLNRDMAEDLLEGSGRLGG